MTAAWIPGKAMVEGKGGMVAAQHEVAARAGASVLVRGGNAMDAAVTAALVLSVVEPSLSGIGGGGFLIWRAADGTRRALDFSMISPSGIRIQDYPVQDGKDGHWFDWPSVEENRNLIGVHSICVPGAVAGLSEALSELGSISWAEALQPAIEEAERGLLIDWFAILSLSIDVRNLLTDKASSEVFLRDGHVPAIPHAGPPQRLPLERKAVTLRRLADAGPSDFYTGLIAKNLIADMAALGGRMTLADLAAYRPRWREPLCKEWRGARILAMPGLSGGPGLLDALEGIGPGGSSSPDAAYFAGAADAICSAYNRRLNSSGHAAATGIDPGCTTHLSVIDAAGNAVSLTNTLLSRFGSKVTSAQTGILLNNGMMWFDPRPGKPNSIAPGVQPLANMCPVIAELSDGAILAIGAAGGRQIMPAIAQLLSFRILHGMDIGHAMSHPRLDASGRRVVLDRRLPDGVLRMIGQTYDVEVVDNMLYPVQFAIPSAAERCPDGSLRGMVHPNHPWSAAVSAEEAANAR
jgi:gamma-glutamyltranspeptidase/glutathione hydrolase